MKNAAYFCVPAIPEIGKWVVLDHINSWEDVYQELTSASASKWLAGENILASAADFLAAPFLRSDGSFDLEGFISCREAEGSDDAKIAFLQCFWVWDADRFRNYYLGTAESDEAFVRQFLMSAGWLAGVSAEIARFIDWSRVTAFYMATKFTGYQGHYFMR